MSLRARSLLAASQLPEGPLRTLLEELAIASGTGSGGGVTSFAARTGVVTPQAGDYAAFYQALSGKNAANGYPGLDPSSLIDRAQVPLGGLAVSVDAAGSGTLTLPATIARTFLVEVTGLLTGDRLLDFPAVAGATWSVTNKTTGPYLLGSRIAGGSRVVYTAPNQTKALGNLGGQIRGPSDTLFSGFVDQSLVALLAASPVNTRLVGLPAGLLLTRADVTGLTNVAGGSAALALGTASGGAQILQSTAAPALGALIGEDPSQWGLSLSLVGSALLQAASALWLSEIITTADITDGQVRVKVEGEVVLGSDL